MDANLADFGVPSGIDDHIRLGVTGNGRGSAIVSPTMGWSSYGRLFTVARVAHLTYESFNTTPSRDLDPETVNPHQCRMGPVSKALYDYGAEQAHPSEFWKLTSDGMEIRIFWPTNCSIAEFGRIKTSSVNGACASARKLVGNDNWPAARRKSSPRGISGLLRARGQLGLPTSMHTDACLGYSAMGY